MIQDNEGRVNSHGHPAVADTVTIHAAKTHLSKLVARAEAGEEIVIARGDKPVAKLVPLVPAPPRRPGFGCLRHLGSAGDEALDTWTEEELA
jgi:prevent-host-death family protein